MTRSELLGRMGRWWLHVACVISGGHRCGALTQHGTVRVGRCQRCRHEVGYR